jgi:hypothetical protein
MRAPTHRHTRRSTQYREHNDTEHISSRPASDIRNNTITRICCPDDGTDNKLLHYRLVQRIVRCSLNDSQQVTVKFHEILANKHDLSVQTIDYISSFAGCHHFTPMKYVWVIEHSSQTTSAATLSRTNPFPRHASCGAMEDEHGAMSCSEEGAPLQSSGMR